MWGRGLKGCPLHGAADNQETGLQYYGLHREVLVDSVILWAQVHTTPPKWELA